jgi:hypothetical protein
MSSMIVLIVGDLEDSGCGTFVSSWHSKSIMWWKLITSGIWSKCWQRVSDIALLRLEALQEQDPYLISPLNIPEYAVPSHGWY